MIRLNYYFILCYFLIPVHHLPPQSRYHAFSGRPNHDDSVHVDARNGQCECYFCQLRYFVLLYPLAVWRTVPNFVGPLATKRECHTSLKRRVWRSERTQIINSTKKCKDALILRYLESYLRQSCHKKRGEIFAIFEGYLRACPQSSIVSTWTKHS